MPPRPERQTMSGVMFEKAASDYLWWFKAHRKSVLSTRYAIRLLVKAFAGLTVEEMTFERLEDWLLEFSHERGDTREARSTANRYLVVVRGVLNHAAARHSIADRPWMELQSFRLSPLPATYLEKSDVVRLLNICDQNFRDLVHAAVLTGARYGELGRLTKDQVVTAPGERFQYILIKEGKTGSRAVYLNREATDLFSDLRNRSPSDHLFLRPNGEPWGRGHQISRMHIATRRAGIKRATFHTLRHTFAAHSLMGGASLEAVRRQLGHRNISTTVTYYGHLSESWRSRDAKKHNPAYLQEKQASEPGQDSISTVSSTG